MNDKQRRFADEYLIDNNATRAYRTAYPSVKSDQAAAVNGSQLLRKTKVKEYIEKQMQEIHDEKIADAKEVMEYLTRVLRGESTSEEIIIEGTGEGRSEARKIDRTPSEKDRLKAADLLGKRYGLYTERIETDIDMNINVSIDYGEDDADNGEG